MDDKRNQINNEIDKPLSDMDVDLIEAQVNPHSNLYGSERGLRVLCHV